MQSYIQSQIFQLDKKIENYILEHPKGEVGWRNGYVINIHYKFHISYKIHNLF